MALSPIASLSATHGASSTVAPVPSAATTNGTADSGQPGSWDHAVINVATKDTPGIVQITNEQVPLGLQNSSGQAVPAGVGTGVVLDEQGHILTNDHVVRGAQKLLVSVAKGGKEYPAKIVGTDVRTDLAVIQVTGANLPPLELGDSSKLQVGQYVVAIGNALALRGGPTVTSGVVSALDRTAQEPPPVSQGGQPGGATVSGPTPGGPYLFDLIQTSAPINPGNSGGPLVDLEGRVVGINTLGAGLAEPGVPSQGISFAIAINTAKRVAAELIARGHVTYAFLGVGTVDNTPALASQYGLPDVPGVAVYSIAPGSPAEQAGIASKDVITQIGSTAIQTTGDLQQALTGQKPGDTVHIQWVKAGTNQKMAKDVVLIESPATPTP